MTSVRVFGHHETERWFLQRGLPAVLTPRARWRGLLRRSAPGLAAWATLMVGSLVVMAASGGRDINIDDDPSAAEWLALVVFALTVPLAAVAGWAVSRLRTDRARWIAAVIAIATGIGSDLYHDGPLDAVADVAIDLFAVAAILVGTATGLGAVLAWALRVTVTHLASLGRLMARALPVVLLTVLAFFNSYVWSMASTITGPRMWLVVAFMAAIAISFLINGLLDRVNTMLAGAAADDRDDSRLGKTPFAALPDPPAAAPLTRAERMNVVFVAIATQVIQIFMVALTTAAIFLVLGLIMLSPPLLDKWTAGDTVPAVWMGFTIPVSAALVHVALFLGALTFMYISARTISDAEYRREFLDPLVEDVRLALVARNRYRTRAGL